MTKRRAHGEGSIRKRSDGRWEATLPAGIVGPKKKSFYGQTQAAAIAKMNHAKSEVAQGRDLVPARLTVDTILNDWLTAKKNTVRPGTWQRYEQFVRIHLSPSIGHIKASKLHARDLNTMYARFVDSGMSPTTCGHIHRALHAALKNGMKLDLLSRNVATLAEPPRPADFEITPLDLDQVAQLVDAASSERWGALYIVAVTTGMREGELLGLRWCDVDLGRCQIRVRRSLKRQPDNSLEIVETKTKTSTRTLDVVTLAAETLTHHRAAQAAERLRLGPGWNDLDLVFPNRLGKPMSATNLTRRSFTPFLAEAGLPSIRFHDLRHTFATLLIASGANIKVVSEYLGHSDVVTTLRTYAHVLPNMQADTIRSFGDQLSVACGL